MCLCLGDYKCGERRNCLWHWMKFPVKESQMGNIWECERGGPSGAKRSKVTWNTVDPIWTVLIRCLKWHPRACKSKLALKYVYSRPRGPIIAQLILQLLQKPDNHFLNKVHYKHKAQFEQRKWLLSRQDCPASIVSDFPSKLRVL